MIRFATSLLLSLTLCLSFVAAAHPSLMRCLNTDVLYFGQRVCEEKAECCQVKLSHSRTEKNTPAWSCCQFFDLDFEWVMPERVSKEVEILSKLSFVPDGYRDLEIRQHNDSKLIKYALWPPPHGSKPSQNMLSRYCIRLC